MVFSAREEWELRLKYKRKKRELWRRVLEHHRIGLKWGLDPIPKKYWGATVLLMEATRSEQEAVLKIAS